MSNPVERFGTHFPEPKFEVLLRVCEAIASHRDVGGLFHELAGLLHLVVEFDFISLVLHDDANRQMNFHLLETTAPIDQSFIQPLAVEDSPGGWAWHNQQPLRCDIQELRARFPKIVPMLEQQGICSHCVVPLTTPQRRLGALAFGSVKPNAYSDADIHLIEQVVRPVAAAVDNALSFQSAKASEATLADERDRLRTLLEVNNAIVAHLDIRELLAAISTSIRRVLGNEFTSLSLYDPIANLLRLHALDFPGSKGVIQQGTQLPVEGSPAGIAFASRQVYAATCSELESKGVRADILGLLVSEGFKAVCCVPLIRRGKALGTLNVASRREDTFTSADITLLTQIGSQVAIAVENALAYEQISNLTDRLTSEKHYLEDEIRTGYDFQEIVGESPALRRCLDQVQTVASSDCTVLLLGETGTGKELIARAIHNFGARAARSFIKLNCAAIPTGLLESELFGHEKGAFTGAISRKIGRFELADKGTLFLDEVGDIALELQPKLLRALQEREFERLGSARTIHVDVRLVAATHQDLRRMVEERHFRSDLYYRLNVFPIVVPTLRERREDVPLLVRHFAQKYGRRMNRRIDSIPSSALQALCRWEWPGNVRELENLIERAVILTHGTELNVPISELQAGATPIAPPEKAPATATLESAEREHILRILRDTNGIVAGPRGAAARLGLKRTTLLSKMQRLGISPRHFT